MKRSAHRRVVQEAAGPSPDKVGWVRQFCGRGLFRELWKNRYLVLQRERLWLCTKEVKEERGAQLILDLSQFERCEELKKEKSKSKKSHSRFILQRGGSAPNTVHSLVFVALSPEEKESWIQVLTGAISRAKTRPTDPTLDQVELFDGTLLHMTKERVRVPLGRRLPSRGHLLAVSSSSHGALTFDLAEEELWGGAVFGSGAVDCRVVGVRQRAGTDVSKLKPSIRDTSVNTGSLPRTSERNWGRGTETREIRGPKTRNLQVFKGQSRTPQLGKKLSAQGRNRCASLDEVLRPVLVRSELRSALRRSPSEDTPPVQLPSLIVQRMQRAQELLEELRLQELQKTKAQKDRATNKNSPKSQTKSSSAGSGSPRGKTKDSGQTKLKKSKSKTKNQTKTRAQTKTRDPSRTSQRPQTRSGSHRAQTCPQSSPKSTQNSPVQLQRPEPHQQTPAPDQDFEQGLNQDLEEVLEEESDPDQDLEQDLEPEQEQDPDQDQDSDSDLNQELAVELQRAEAQRLLQEALCSWKQAQEVLQEVKELQSQTLRRQRRKTFRDHDLDPRPGQREDQDLDPRPDQREEQDLDPRPDQREDQKPNQREDQELETSPDQRPEERPERDLSVNVI
ncbi:unnamed protein product [Knipowitschia caucasica]